MPVTLAQWNAHKRRQQNPLWPSSSVFWNDFAIFTVGCAGALSVNFVGSLPGDEIVASAFLPFLLFNHGKRAFRREYLWFYILLGGWLFGTIVGDLYLGVSVTNKLKGISRVIFFGLNFITLAILIDKKTRGVIVFALSIVVVFAASARSFQGESSTVWKYGGGYALSIVAFLVSSYFYTLRRYWICVFLSLGLAVLNLIYAFRSQIAVDLISIVLILLTLVSACSRGKVGMSRTSETLRVVILLGLASGAAYAANEGVKYAVSQNWFSENIEAKFEAQSGGKLGVLVGGRPETLVAIQAIRDSPIIGHGSFAEDPKYVQMMQDIQYKYDYTDSDEPSESLGLAIPTHSHLTEAWVESGILGGVFWIYIIVLVIRGFLQLMFNRPSMTPLYCFFLISFAWDILYSPMGGVNRMIGDFYILICYDLLEVPAAKASGVSRWRWQRDRAVYARARVRLLARRSRRFPG